MANDYSMQCPASVVRCLKLVAILRAGEACRRSHIGILRAAFRSEPVERRARPEAELEPWRNEASAQKGPRFR